MNNSWPSHLAELGRARRHLSLLHKPSQSLSDSEAYAVYTERDPDTGEVIVYGEARGEPPKAESILLSEAWHYFDYKLKSSG
jgi:hypothetical protein